MSDAAQELFDFFAEQGLHPYRLPLACEFAPGCRSCQGYLCDRNCKNDSARACLVPALGLGATLLDECDVVRLEARGDRVTTVVCRRRGRELRLSAETIVLAAGALESPALLLRSVSSEWPNGLANGSGMVGRGLMRHYVDLYAVFPKARPSSSGNPKELALRDFYLSANGKFGSLQSFGSMPPAKLLVDALQQDVVRKFGKLAAASIGPAKPILRYLMFRIFARAHVLATITEDLPYTYNQVAIANGHGDGAKLIVRYEISDAEANRIAIFRAQVRKMLKPYRYLLIKQAENNQMLAHACGTCRFGLDPQQSVLDAMNKAHGLQNLYVVDASFFPSSGGTNPGLTVAANALRVAAHLVGTAWSRRSPLQAQNSISFA